MVRRYEDGLTGPTTGSRPCGPPQRRAKFDSHSALVSRGHRQGR